MGREVHQAGRYDWLWDGVIPRVRAAQGNLGSGGDKYYPTIGNGKYDNPGCMVEGSPECCV